MMFSKRLLKATAQCGMGMACVNQYRPSRDGMWAACPRSAFSSYRVEFHEGCYQKHTNPLNCRTSSSDISGYHQDFHKGHGMVGEWQGHGMTCVNYPLVAQLQNCIFQVLSNVITKLSIFHMLTLCCDHICMEVLKKTM
jgi:hypothetical protein